MIVKIKKGNHWSNQLYGLLFRNKYCFEFSFCETAKYDLKSEDQYDLNKLAGIADFKLFLNGKLKNPAHIQSCRVGWRYVNGKFQIASYTYVNGKRHVTKDGVSIISGRTYVVKISKIRSGYMLMVKDKYDDKIILTRMTETMKRPTSISIKLPGYFGGNRTAPNDIEYYFK